MQIIPLSEGAFTVDQTKNFVPFIIDKDDLQQRTKGSILVEIQPFVIITSKDVLLLDTGLGFSDDKGLLQIHKNLLSHGIQPADVTKVLLSHLHKDHSGGMCYQNKNKVSFANANYYINKNEWEYAFQKQSSSYITGDYECLVNNKQLQFIQGSGTISGYIHYEETGAHCPFHQVFLIEENNEKIFFGGDVAPQLQQMKNRFKAKYDYDPAKAMDLRIKWWQQGKEEKWTFLFYHDIKYPSYRF